MPDARVIPLDDGRARRGRPDGQRAAGQPSGGQQPGRPEPDPEQGSAPKPARAADAVARGAARAGGERERRRRRTTPLLEAAEQAGQAGQAAGQDDSGQDAPGQDDRTARSPQEQQPPRRRPRSASAPARPGVRAADRTGRAARARLDDEERAELLEQARAAGEALAAEAPSAAHTSSADAREVADWERKAAQALAFLRRRLTGDYEIDEFGFDRELTDTVLLALARPLYSSWFRVETAGMANVPAEGAGLVVANHAGTVAVDSVMTQLALLDHHPARRALRMLGADLVFTLPFVGEFARKGGATLACNEDAERLLGGGELVGVWPEGFKGIGKPFRERYKLQRFGRGGFVAAALRTGAPIIPCSIVGSEEIYPIIGNLGTLARLLGLPYVPVTPTFPLLGPLGLVPLPSKWMIEFGEPIETAHHGPAAADDPMLVFNLTDQVRETIQHTLYKLLMQRRSVFF